MAELCHFSRNFTLETNIHFVERIILMGALAMGSLWYPILVYIIFTQSYEQMVIYKYMLFLHLTFSYLLDLNRVLWQPFIIYPYYVENPNPLIDLGPYSFHIFFAITIVCCTGIFLTLIFSMFYRLIRISANDIWLWIFGSRKGWITFCAIYLILGILIVITPFIMAIPTVTESNNSSYKDNCVVLKPIFNLNPNNTLTFWSIAVIIEFFLFSYTVPVALISLHISFIVLLRNVQRTVGVNIYRLHQSHFR